MSGTWFLKEGSGEDIELICFYGEQRFMHSFIRFCFSVHSPCSFPP